MSKSGKEAKKNVENGIALILSPYFLIVPKRNGASHLIFQLEFSVLYCKWNPRSLLSGTMLVCEAKLHPSAFSFKGHFNE